MEETKKYQVAIEYLDEDNNVEDSHLLDDFDDQEEATEYANNYEFDEDEDTKCQIAIWEMDENGNVEDSWVIKTHEDKRKTFYVRLEYLYRKDVEVKANTPEEAAEIVNSMTTQEIFGDEMIHPLDLEDPEAYSVCDEDWNEVYSE